LTVGDFEVKFFLDSGIQFEEGGPMDPIVLNQRGDALVCFWADQGLATEDSLLMTQEEVARTAIVSVTGIALGTHEGCGGYFHLKESIFRGHRTIFCSECGLSVLILEWVRTYGFLRRHLGNFQHLRPTFAA